MLAQQLIVRGGSMSEEFTYYGWLISKAKRSVTRFGGTVGVELYLFQQVGDGICMSIPTRMYKKHLHLILCMLRNLVFISTVPKGTYTQYSMSYLTLGVLAQRGLLYLVCVSVCVCLCVCLYLFSPYRDQASSSATPTALAQQGLKKLCGDFA